MTVRQRHGTTASVRPTHSFSGIDTSTPDASGVLYSSQSDVDPASVLDIGQGSITDGAIAPPGLNGGGSIAPGTLPLATFASSIRPIVLVTALPTLPDAQYPIGSFVYKTNDVPPRLYKNVADVWVAAIGPNDIQADSITAGQIAVGAISASEIAAGAVTTAKLAAGAITLYDEYGQVALTPQGFGGAWVDFIGDGTYDSTFRLSTAGAIPDGRTASLPNWTVSRGLLTSLIMVADAAWPGGGYLEAIPSALNGSVTLVSDRVPIAPIQPLIITVVGGAIVGGTAVPVIWGTIRFYGADGTTLISTIGGQNLATFNVSGAGPLVLGSKPLPAPPGARFAEIEIVVQELTAHSASTRLRIGGASLRRSPAAGAQAYAWGPGSGPGLAWGSVTNVAVGTAFFIPITVTSPLEMGGCGFLSADTTLARQVGFHVYRDVGSNIIEAVPNMGGSLSWTATAKGSKIIPIQVGGILAPGNYILRLQNTHATNTLGLGYHVAFPAAAGYGTSTFFTWQDAAAGAFAATYDMTPAVGLGDLMGAWLTGWSAGLLWGG